MCLGDAWDRISRQPPKQLICFHQWHSYNKFSPQHLVASPRHRRTGIETEWLEAKVRCSETIAALSVLTWNIRFDLAPASKVWVMGSQECLSGDCHWEIIIEMHEDSNVPYSLIYNTKEHYWCLDRGKWRYKVWQNHTIQIHANLKKCSRNFGTEKKFITTQIQR